MELFGFTTVTREERFHPCVQFEGKRYVSQKSFPTESEAEFEAEAVYDRAARAAKKVLVDYGMKLAE